MANEIEYSNPSVTAGGLTTLYAVITQGGQCVLASTGSPATINGTNWPNAAIAIADTSSNAYYLGSWPSNVAAGVYSVQIRQKAGAGAALSDGILASHNGVIWTGAAVGPLLDASGFPQVDVVLVNGGTVTPEPVVGGAAGNGSANCTQTFKDNSGNPIQGASVWVSSDAAGKTVVAGTLITNSAGQVTFLLVPGTTYYMWMTDAGENSINGTAFVAVAD